MTATRLTKNYIHKVWGRHDLPAGFRSADETDEPVGEVSYSYPNQTDQELLVKYLFTKERLSVQVHPDDRTAQAAGFPRGKDEAWLVLSAEPGATIAIGTREPMTPEQLRAASLDGSIESLLEWHPVKAGDFFYSPAGTIHAIGAGVALIEVQQNLDLTYRLYDYGRPRELHLDEGVAATRAVPFRPATKAIELSRGRLLLAQGPSFIVERWTGQRTAAVQSPHGPIWIIPLRESADVDGHALEPGSVWTIEGAARLNLGEAADLLLAYSGEQLLSLPAAESAGRR
jgi:mannose-6-phosphate isomerase